MIYFSKPSITDLEKKYVAESLSGKLCGDGDFTQRATKLLCDILKIENTMLTTSASTALEMGCILADIKPGDEVIVPSFTFSSSANAILLRGAHPRFIDVRPESMNINEDMIESLINERTKAIMPVDYAGVVPDADKINAIARKHNLFTIEDAAQSVGSSYKGKPAGSLFDFGAYSFHDTKNYTMGEGGALVVNRSDLVDRAYIIREKGTDRTLFIKGAVDKYTWRDLGSSYLPSDMLAALLTAQLERFSEIMDKRMAVYNTYEEMLSPLVSKGKIKINQIPDYATHNAHMFFVIVEDEATRNRVIAKLKERGIIAVFHYIPLHSAPKGVDLGYKEGMLPVTEEYSARLLRLPLYADMSIEDAKRVAESFMEVL